MLRNWKARRRHQIADARHTRRRPVLESLEGRTLLASNRIITENMLPGTPQAQWDVSGVGDPSLQGYATNISVNVGETVQFKITNTNLAPYRIDVYRIGYYGGAGARLVGSVPSSQTLAVNQPAPLTDRTTGLVDAGNWSVTASWSVPTDAVSGVYFAKVVREDNGGASHIVFIVRDDSSQSDILFQTSDTTWQAYNDWGGNSLYFGTGPGKNGAAYKVSYNRPFSTRGTSGGLGSSNWFFYAEYPMIRWMEQNGYDVSYFAGVDSDRYGAEILEHKVFASVGHDEYWSGNQRANVEAALGNGVNLAFFSGNEMFWKIRYETSIDGTGTPHRTMVCYKETHANAQIDPMSISNGVWTGTWMDPRFSPPADGGRPQNALTGNLFTVNRGPHETGTPFTVPDTYAPMRFWRNTSVAQLQPGQTATIGDYYLGYEWNEDVDNGFRPAGLINLSSTTQNVTEKFIDYGSTVAPGTATHSLTLYRAPSGAMVFGAGTIQWSWGLDSVAYSPTVISTSDTRVQQATLNLFADMNVQPGSIMPGLIWSSPSTDLTAPFSTIASPASSSVFTTGVPVTISGTAADNGGGVVAGVEISTDGGRTWHPANGRNNWSYTWTPITTGPATILSRATDDSVNTEVPSSSVSVTVALAATNPSGLVAAFNFNEGSGGTANDQSGKSNNGTLSNVTWAAGRSGGAASFNGTNSWITIPHNASLNLTTGMTLEAWVNPTTVNTSDTVILKEGSGFSPYNLYSADNPIAAPPNANIRTSGSSLIKATQPLTPGTWNHLAATYDGSSFKLYVNGVLTTTSNAVSGSLSSSTGPLRIGGNAVYSNEFFQGLIDDVRVYNRALSLSEIQANMSTPVGGSLDASSPTVAITSPANNQAISGPVTITASASDNVAIAGVQFLLNGAPLGAEIQASPYSFTWDPATMPTGRHTLTARARDLAGNFATSSAVSVQVNNPLDITPPSVRLLNPSNGAVVGGSLVLWAIASDDRGTPRVQFQVDGTNVGQPVTSAPYRIAWDSTTVASGQHTITAIATDTEGNTTSTSVSVTIDSSRPVVSSQSPSPGSTNVSTASAVVAVFNESVQPGSITITVTGPQGTLAGSVTYNPATRTATFTHPSPLKPQTVYTARVSGAVDSTGNMMAPVSWTFTTDSGFTDASLWGGIGTPEVASANDTASIEVGIKFTSEISGFITGLSFFKGSANTGTHVGRLWTATGTLLASATFAGETASGWQRVNFASPVAIDANTIYVASYYAPNGGYSITTNMFSSAGRDNSPLHAPSSATSGGNGVFRYGVGGGFPTSSFNATNYWVDVSFSSGANDTTAPTVTSRSPAAGATGVPTSTPATAVFSEPVQSASITFTLKDPAGASVAASLSYNPATTTATLTPNAPLAASTTYSLDLSGATDTAGNVMAPISWSFTTAATPTTATTIWPSTATPAVASVNDTASVELGVKFRSDSSGSIAGVRFYKGAANTGTHLGRLWSSTGTLLASATFAGETASGWQEVRFASPVVIAANTTYVVSYYAPSGGYSASSAYFASTGADSGPLHALASGVDGGNGVFRYGAGGGFPTSSFNATNYWVDVVFSTSTADTTAPTVTSRSPAAGATGVPTSTPATAVFSEPVQSASITFTLKDPAGASVAASLSYNPATTTATLTPNAPLAASTTYSLDLSGATDTAGNVMAPISWSFTTAATPTTATTIWPSTATPAVASVNDTASVELGVKFRSDSSGSIAGVRFYKGAANTGTHLGRLWSSTGTLLASATFAGETASGWQEVRFASPVVIAANTTYVVSYYAPSGGYSASSAYFASTGADSGPLHALASGVDGGNGVFRYGAGGGFPTSSFNATNYWVDVVFSTSTADTTAPTVTSRSPAAGATGVPTSTPATAVFSEPVQSASITFTLKDPAGASVAASLSYNPATTTATLTPNAPLAASTTYSLNLSGATDTAGNVMAPISWSFTTASQPVPPSQWTQTTAAEFSGGTLDGTTVTNSDGGEVQLASNLVDDFSRTSLGADWVVKTWKASASNQISGGVVAVLGEAIFSAQPFAVAPVEGRVEFSGVPYQHFGLATDLENASTDTWVIFSTGTTSNTLFARVNVAGTSGQANLGALPTGFHTYRIDPTSTGFNFLIDGVVRASLAANLPAGLGLKIVASDYNNASPSPLRLDWVRRAGGTFTSSVFDAGSVATWGQATWTANMPTGTTLAIETTTSLDGVTWSPWAAVANGGTVSNPSGRYARYRAKLATNDPTVTPVLTAITLRWS